MHFIRAASLCKKLCLGKLGEPKDERPALPCQALLEPGQDPMALWLFPEAFFREPLEKRICCLEQDRGRLCHLLAERHPLHAPACRRMVYAREEGSPSERLRSSSSRELLDALEHCSGAPPPCPVQTGKLAYGCLDDGRRSSERPGTAARSEDAVHLLADTLVRDMGKSALAGDERSLRGRLQGEAEAGAEAHGAQDPERIFREARFRVPDRPDDAAVQIPAASVGVEKPPRRMPCHGVHREVAPGKVELHVVHELDRIGMAEIGIGAFGAVRRALDRLARDDRGHGPMGGPRLMDLDSGCTEHPLGLLPGRLGRDIHIVGGVSFERIAHPSADDPCLVPCILEDTEHPLGIGRKHLGVYR